MDIIKKYAVIVAGGSGKRMNSSIPKQFLEVNGLPILMHTINAFHQYDASIDIVLVLAASEIEYWDTLVKKYKFSVPVRVQAGGETRFQSVKAGLGLINTSGLVAIHDGVRPLITSEIIHRAYEAGYKNGTAITSVEMKESIRMVTPTKSKALDRKEYRTIQTPQVFKCRLIKDAYLIEENEMLTDDASVAEKAGYIIHLIEGSYENLKITTPEDLVLAEAILNQREKLETSLLG
jgi:2-C-methyl-D-erythritol 4-phosphate cytidylyltransferase